MPFLAGVVFLYSLFGLSFAGVRTVTVDDTTGDEMTGVMPFYSSTPVSWAAGQDCSTCLAQPDKSIVHDGTWHDTTISNDAHDPHPGQRWMSVNFVGHSVSAFFVTLDANVFIGTVLTNVTFAVDGNLAGSFTSNPAPGTGYNYNVLGFSTNSLANASHELNISTTGDNSLVLFDYLTYSFDLPDPPPSSTSTSTPQQPSSSSTVPNSSSISPSSGLSPIGSQRSQTTVPPTGSTSSGTGIITTQASSPVSSPTSSPPTTTSTLAGQAPTMSPHTQLSEHKGVNLGLIIGIVLGCVLVIVILLLYCWRRKKPRRNVLRWEKIHSILGTNSTFVEPEPIPQNRHSHLLAEKEARLRMDEIEAPQVREADLNDLEQLSPRSSITLRPSDSASNVRVPAALPTVDPQHLGELLALRAKIKALQEEEQILAESTR